MGLWPSSNHHVILLTTTKALHHTFLCFYINTDTSSLNRKEKKHMHRPLTSNVDFWKNFEVSYKLTQTYQFVIRIKILAICHINFSELLVYHRTITPLNCLSKINHMWGAWLVFKISSDFWPSFHKFFTSFQYNPSNFG